LHKQEQKIINVPVSQEIYRKLFQRRLETGVPVYKIAEGLLKFESFALDSFDWKTSFRLTDDALTMLHAKIFRDKLASKQFPTSDLKLLDAIIARAEAFLTKNEKGERKENENRSDA
jgi:hypothetical protein